MAKIITDNQHYADIAAAIRAKNETDTLYKPSEMAPAILAIQGGVELNFEVVGGMTKPSNPKENTIWVDTNQEITSWIFSASEPESPTNGMVWITVGTSSIAEFNALKDNGIQVYPDIVKQYANDGWKSVPAMVYQDGEWIELVKYLFNYGKQEYTWQARAWAYNSAGTGRKPTVVQNDDGSVSLSLTASSGEYLGGAYELAKDVDLTSIDHLELDFEYSANFPSWRDSNLYLLVIDRNNTYWGGNAVAQTYVYHNDYTSPITLDVKSLSGVADVALALYSGGSAGTHTCRFKQLKMVEIGD